MRIAWLIKMFLIPASAVEPGQLLTFALLQSFFCCGKHFLNTCAVKQFYRSFHKCIMQHMHMCIHKTGQHQPSLKVDPLFAGKSFRFFISSHKNDPAIFDSHSLCHFFTVIQCSYTSVKKNCIHCLFFLFFFFILVEKCHILVYLSDSHVTRLVILQQFKEGTT